MKNILSLLFMMIVLSAFTGCHTVAGAGQDVSAAGHGVTKAADKVEKKMGNY